MHYGLILAGGVGQRMRTSGLPKQFLEVFGKPIIIYTIEKFEKCRDIDRILVVCNAAWLDHMKEIVSQYRLSKVIDIVAGGRDRQLSIKEGLTAIRNDGGKEDDTIVIHDGVRPLVQDATICENIRVAEQYGGAMTVRPVVESVVVTDSSETAGFENFKNRKDTYSLTSPQTFRLGTLETIYRNIADKKTPYPLLDSALVYTFLGNNIHMVIENNNNIKITTPEDYYILKAMLELEENRYVFGF